jgi:uncharacterized membrane protein
VVKGGWPAPTFCKRPVKGGGALVVRDVVTNLFHRIGMVGAIVIASALIFGALAGGVIVHRLDTTPSASSEQAQGDQSGQKAGEGANTSQGSKNNGANRGGNNGQQDSSNSENSQDKDV